MKNINNQFVKYIKTLHTALGIIPFIWFVLFLIILIAGTIHFGEIPQYGNPIDPYALGLDNVSLAALLFFILGHLSFFLWLILTTVIYIFFRNKIVLNKLSIILFLIGIGGFLIFKYGFTETFLWVFD